MKISFKLNKPSPLGREIMLRVSHQGRPTHFFTGYHVPDKFWDGDKVSNRYPGAAEINRNISQQRSNLEKLCRDMEYEIGGRGFTVSDIRARYKPEQVKHTPHGLLNRIEDFIKEKKGELKVGTLGNYNTLLNKHLPVYEKRLGREILVSDVDAAWLKKFSDFLNDTQKLTNDSVHKLIGRLKAVLAWVKADTDYRDFKTMELGKEVVFLEWDELMDLWDLKVPDGLRPSLDMFLFSCFTGMRHSDVMAFDKSAIRGDFIWIRQIKTTDQAFVPINKYSRELLERYDYSIPKVSGPNVNANLKIIGLRAEIDSPQKQIRYRGIERLEQVLPKHDLLTFHVGRSTFIMTHLAKGIAAEGVMKMTGHKDYSSFQRYVRFSEALLLDISKRVYSS